MERRSAIPPLLFGGSDARIIMGDDEGPLCCDFGGRNAGRAEPEDLSGNLWRSN